MDILARRVTLHSAEPSLTVNDDAANVPFLEWLSDLFLCTPASAAVAALARCWSLGMVTHERMLLRLHWSLGFLPLHTKPLVFGSHGFVCAGRVPS